MKRLRGFFARHLRVTRYSKSELGGAGYPGGWVYAVSVDWLGCNIVIHRLDIYWVWKAEK